MKKVSTIKELVQENKHLYTKKKIAQENTLSTKKTIKKKINISILLSTTFNNFRDIYSGHSPPPWVGNFLSNLKTGMNLKEDFIKKREKRRKEEKEKSDNTCLNTFMKLK